MKTLRVRDGFATINGDPTEYELPSGSLEIIAEDGKTLFGISLTKEGGIRVDSGRVCKHNGIILDDAFQIAPIATNAIMITKKLAEFGTQPKQRK